MVIGFVAVVALLFALFGWLCCGHLHNRIAQIEKERVEQQFAIAKVQATANELLVEIQAVSSRFGPTRYGQR